MFSCRYSAAILLFFFLAAGTFLFYPSDPEIGLDRIRLNHIEIQTTPKPTLNLSFSLTVKVRNRDFFPLSYDSLDVSVSYRGRQIGFVSSVDGGCIRLRGSSYVDVVLTVDGFEVIYNALYLLQDIAEGVITFDTDTRVEGKFGRFFFDVPLKAIVSCQVYVNINSVVVNINRVVVNIKRVVAAVAIVGTLISAILRWLHQLLPFWKLLTYLTGKMLVVSRQVYVNINSVGAMAIVGIVKCAILSHRVKRWIRTLMMELEIHDIPSIFIRCYTAVKVFFALHNF